MVNKEPPVLSQPAVTDRPEPPVGAFWGEALLGVPTFNVLLLSAAALFGVLDAVSGTGFLVGVVLLVLAGLAFLIVRARRYGAGAVAVAVSMIASLTITAIVVVLIMAVAFSITCGEGCDGLS
jgi:hypothetical protein